MKEARHHQVDGAVTVGEPAYFSTRALERAGIPVLDLGVDNVDARQWNEAEMRGRLADFIEQRVVPVAQRRRPD